MRCCSPITLSGRLHFLDALRGIAALGVMFFHFCYEGVSPVAGQLAAILPHWMYWLFNDSYSGIDIFFVLSGFVIAFSMDGQTANWRYAGNFIVRRSLRLDPPYWTVIAITFASMIWRWPDLAYKLYIGFGSWQGIVANLFYVQNLPLIYPAKSIVDVSWTLCLEVQFYLSYLLILVAACYAGRLSGRWNVSVRRVIMALAVGAVGAWSAWNWLHVRGDAFTGRSWMFFMGVMLYLGLTRGAPVWLMLTALTTLLALFIWKRDQEAVVAVATGAAICFVGMTHRLGTLLAWKPLLWLGKISYSIYLLHMLIGLPILDLAAKQPAGWATWGVFLGAIAASLLGAQVLHWIVEAPSNRLSQKLKPRRHRKRQEIRDNDEELVLVS